MIEKNIRIIYYGTPEIAAFQLEHLIREGYNVVAVVTQPDKPSGRGQKLSESAVKQIAIQYNLPVLQPEKLKTAEFEQQIRELKPDMQIVMAYRMIPESIYSIAPYGTFNLHTSLLPQYRGAAPINRAIMNGETQSGITNFLLNDKVDCGKNIHSQPIEITERMTAGELHDEMMRLSPMLIEKTISTLLSENPKLEEQTIAESEELKTAPKLFKPDMLIDWTWSGKRIIDHIRGLSPYPAAFAEFEDRQTDKKHQIKVFTAEFHPKTIEKDSIGQMNLRDKNLIEVNCSDGVVQITDIQLSGKKRMSAEDFLRGFKIRHSLYACK